MKEDTMIQDYNEVEIYTRYLFRILVVAFLTFDILFKK